MSTPHNENELGKPLRSKKKRGAVFVVIAASVAVHVLGLGIFGVIKIVETISDPPEFEAPPVEAIKPPPPPPPPPPTTKRSQRSLPRPQPLAVQNPQNMSVPSINMQESDLSLGAGRGFGGGLGEVGGGMLDRVDISFFGIESTGDNIVILFDRTGSGRNIFDKTRTELLSTIDMMKNNRESRFAVIYFGGYTDRNNPENKVKNDYWMPKGLGSRPKWLAAESSEAEKIKAELIPIDASAPGVEVRSADAMRKSKNAFFVTGTNFWGAINAAFSMKPAPDTIYFMVEPNIAFAEVAKVNSDYALFKKKGRKKPDETTVYFIVGRQKNTVKNQQALNLMVNLIHGGKLSKSEIQKRIVY